MTDKDRDGAYAAEFALRHVLDMAEKYENWNYDFHGYKMQLPQERKFADLASIQAYYEKVMALPSVQGYWPGRTAPTVRPRSNGSAAHYNGLRHEVAICIHRGERFALREIVVLHELAHSLERDQHGPRFRGAFIYLLNVCMGQEAAMLLGSYFHEELGAGHKVVGLQSC